VFDVADGLGWWGSPRCALSVVGARTSTAALDAAADVVDVTDAGIVLHVDPVTQVDVSAVDADGGCDVTDARSCGTGSDSAAVDDALMSKLTVGVTAVVQVRRMVLACECRRSLRRCHRRR
jgi:3-oxoacyl-ACP reductase-like protein